MFKEAAAQTVELKDDKLRAVELMIDYFYKIDYDDTVGMNYDDSVGSTAKREPQGDGAMTNSMELNAWVYALADKYEVLGLRTLALSKFKKSAATLYNNAEVSPKEIIPSP